MSRGIKTYQVVGAGPRCQKCGAVTEHRKHGPAWHPKANQPYFFSEWTACGCGFVHVEERFKILIPVERFK